MKRGVKMKRDVKREDEERCEERDAVARDSRRTYGNNFVPLGNC